MKNRGSYIPGICMAVGFVMSVMLLIPHGSQAQMLFFADFEEGVDSQAFPDISVNDAGNWKPTNAQTVWTVADFANGTKGLKQMTEGCGSSGNTPLPDPKGNLQKIGDFIFEMEFSQGDDDSFAIIFRQTAPDKGYALLLGTMETPKVILGLLDEGCSADGTCWDSNCENANSIAEEPHGIAFNITGQVVYKARLEVIGNSIKLWYGELGKEELLLEAKDGTHKSGAIGIFHESNSNGMIDNVLVMGPAGMAVDPQEKLATTWGLLKE